MKYPIAEKFKAPQGEGMYTGTPMAFIRFVGCSVGKKVCTACDTFFDKPYSHMGGGLFTPEELVDWVGDYTHICITGGEPLDRDLVPFLSVCRRKEIHIETSGTVRWVKPMLPIDPKYPGEPRFSRVHLCVSPKPGWMKEMIAMADEVKVILGGLGDGEGWPTLQDAISWAKMGKVVYIQPRNGVTHIDDHNMQDAMEVVLANPNLRLSAQLHKYILSR